MGVSNGFLRTAVPRRSLFSRRTRTASPERSLPNSGRSARCVSRDLCRRPDHAYRLQACLAAYDLREVVGTLVAAPEAAVPVLKRLGDFA
ncbi:Hypothetical protein MexAM1_META2p0647 (plasmid) [Methylorubrum extorquens AM1]|uniref:Uncharacterized protein n=1 Tax=Methylorubrum extorquens (strain ATCC 14718 / DSM 1338 / JCM 2805 / NCIMB 9133 / AM1) TaxID=272630 RepID=C5B4W1_METEA|nr:Hypothetical protein MexAM1_META2p0647 [Methylorubrum extorquens AM1]